MLEFDLAEIWSDFNKLSHPERGTLDDNSNQVILGPRFNDAIHDWANGYLEKFKFDDETRAMDERAKLLDLHWGHIEHDGALLRGLGSAMTNFAEVLSKNVGALDGRWKGDSYEAFKAAMESVQRRIAQYGEAATITGESLVNAMTQIRELYQTFAEDSVRTHLHFEVSPPKEWHKVPSDGYRPQDLADVCPSTHPDVMCLKAFPEQQSHVVGHWVTERRWQICKNDPCERNAGRVIIMYDDMVRECQAAIDHIKKKLDNFYGAVKTVTDSVTKLYDIALDNVDRLGNYSALQNLRVIGGQPTGGGAPVGGDPYPTGGGGPYPSGTDVTPTGGDVAPVSGDPGPAVAVEPPQPEEETAPEDGTEPADAVAPDPAADDGESVKIQDGDRTIGVTSPDGEGRVRVTVQGADGQTKTYDLDFGAASGLPSGEAAAATDGVEQIPARTDGKCVIQDGALTITAERPLFSPDSIKLVVDDGSGEPSTYTLDFDDQGTAGEPGTDSAGTDTTAGTDTPGSDTPGTDATAGAEASGQAAGTAQPAVTDQPGTPEPAGQGGAEPVSNGTPASTAPPAGTLTTPQSTWHGDQAGSVSGVLVPDLSGEAQLAAAPDDVESQVGGMVGSGVPVGNAPAAGGQEGGSRPGSGWSVHGDLFDNAEPVYSMHGVLGDDDGVKN